MRAIIITLFLLLHFTDSFYAGVSSPPVTQPQGTVPAWKLKLVDHLQKKYGDHNRRVAAVLAFPVFGIVGLHRIYLGTKPYVPVVYAATLGGCAGLLPLDRKSTRLNSSHGYI